MKFKVPVGIKKILVKAEKNSPAILTGLGIAGGITTTVLAVKATPKALKLIEESKYWTESPWTNWLCSEKYSDSLKYIEMEEIHND